MEHPDPAPAFTPTVRTPQCGHTVWDFFRQCSGKMPQTKIEENSGRRACAVEMHMVMSQEPFYARIYTKNAAPQMEHPDQALAFTPTVRTPQCGHTV